MDKEPKGQSVTPAHRVALVHRVLLEPPDHLVLLDHQVVMTTTRLYTTVPCIQFCYTVYREILAVAVDAQKVLFLLTSCISVNRQLRFCG